MLTNLPTQMRWVGAAVMVWFTAPAAAQTYTGPLTVPSRPVQARVQPKAPAQARAKVETTALPPAPAPLPLPVLPQTTAMNTYGSAEAPYGFVAFCGFQQAECGSTATEAEAEQPKLKLTAESLLMVTAVNVQTNRDVTPSTDAETYGVSEYWTLPNGKGDCEDYALLKKHRLVAAGLPRQALLLAYVMDESNLGHAILILRTTRGDFVLDNKHDEVEPWQKAAERGYTFIARQSFIDPRLWVSLKAPQTASAGQ